MLSKIETRAKYKEIRKSVEYRKEKERAIFCRLIEAYGNAESVFCYESFGSEVSTAEIIKYFTGKRSRLCVPLVSGDDMFLIDFATGQASVRSCELTIVPLLAYDAECNRLGFGKGFYDRYLHDTDTIAVGIAFSEQYCENLPIDTLDVPLSAVITPDMILFRDKNGDKNENYNRKV